MVKSSFSYAKQWQRNDKGKEYALEYAKKIDYISPVWFDIEEVNVNEYGV